MTARPLDEIELVSTDVGMMFFPAWDEFILPVLRSGAQWEPEEVRWLTNAVLPGATVIDVGANVGYHALRLAKLVGPGGRVIALEPDPLNFKLLVRNLDFNHATNVVPIQAAAGEHETIGQLVRSTNNPGDHRLYRHPDLSVRDIIEVSIVPLDRVVDRADVLLLDTQGYEHRVVLGAHELIAQSQPQMLVEFWTQGLEGLGDDPEVVLQVYRKFGYDVRVLGDDRLGLNPEPKEIIAAADATPGRYVSLVLTGAKSHP